MTKEASYIPNKMKVTRIQGLTADTKSLTLEFVDKKAAKDFGFLPGQFVIVSVPGYGESALGITTAPDELPIVEVAVRSVGNTTKALHRLKTGDTIGLRGPFGKPFPKELMAGREILVVAGGIGLAPLRSLIHMIGNEKIKENPLKVFIGATSPNNLMYKHELTKWEKFSEVFVTVDQADGDWKGRVGKITELFDKAKITNDAIAILCGPPAMFVPVIKKLEKAGLKEDQIFALLERRMKCGIGKCQHCTCGDKYVCLDGPTFSWAELKNNWEAFV